MVVSRFQPWTNWWLLWNDKGWSIYTQNLSNLTIEIILKTRLLLSVGNCCEQGFILIEISRNLEAKFYRVRYPFRIQIRTGSWYVTFLEFCCWPTSGRALISGSTIKILNCYAALRLLIWLLSGHWPEEARVRYLETHGALNRKSIRGISQFLLVMQSVQPQNPQSPVSFQRNRLTTESKSALVLIIFFV